VSAPETETEPEPQPNPEPKPGEWPEPRTPHARFGGDALGFAIAGVVCFVVTILLGRRRGALDAMDPDVYQFVPGNIDIDPETLAFDTGVAACGAVGFALIAIGLGVVGVCQRQRDRTCSALGIGVGIATILAVVVVVALGSAAG